MKGLLFPVQVPYKPYDPVRFVVFDLFCRLKPAVLEIDRQLGIQVGCLVKSALYLLRAETCLFKDLVVGQEIDRSTSLFVLPVFGRRPPSSSTTGTPLSYLS